MADKKMNTVELTDEELGEIQGGYCLYEKDGNYYGYTGHDANLKYLCPNCGQPLHESFGWRFCCDSCDESWFFESSLVPNLSSGAWTQISKEQYDYSKNFVS